MEEIQRKRLQQLIEASFRESVRVKEAFLKSNAGIILEMAQLVSRAFREKRRLFLFGNGGSAADAQHLAAEFVNRFERERPPLPAMALSVDTSIITSISNDYHFEDIFLKQLQALAGAGDVALGISTSGRSRNVVKALQWAHRQGLRTLGWAGAERGDMDGCCGQMLHVPSKVTARIQECHITAGHILCALVDEILFGADRMVDGMSR
ncbi:D-sedoheptulose-7-phosphate isomerase [Desulfoferrobacter suflitae]|uniref:D-sedoheptulose-7-phosphate isomerase n=1 Tax=Desulfoferrobacter suflitae TaxID=2865782 RepID=UPI0021648FFE|nr:D-sedoheptulose 7-phosphate isomerase [Desulfoferrobacter suflitae]MCK8600826.1 D-sedoheptulose 7-phosphate isomerase [Desulfoferrobacter suflitae]